MNSASNDGSTAWKAWMTMLQVGMFITAPDWALAQSSTGLPMEDVFCTACLWITGPVGRAIATISVAISALGAMLGKITWGLMMVVGVNVATVFSAALVVNSLAGGAAITQCDANILNQEGGGGFTANFGGGATASLR